MLNVSPDHLDRYPDLQHYADAKAKAYHQARDRIVNRDDPLVVAMTASDADTIGYTLGVPRDQDFGLLSTELGQCLCRGGNPLLPVSELKIFGSHNQQNALAALAMGSALELPMAAMLDALRTFRGLPHRTQFVGEHGGCAGTTIRRAQIPGHVSPH